MKARRSAKVREPVAPRRLPLAKAGAVLALMLLTLAAYAPVRANDFLNYDDDLYVTRNGMVARGLTPSSDYRIDYHTMQTARDEPIRKNGVL